MTSTPSRTKGDTAEGGGGRSARRAVVVSQRVRYFASDSETSSDDSDDSDVSICSGGSKSGGARKRNDPLSDSDTEEESGNDSDLSEHQEQKQQRHKQHVQKKSRKTIRKILLPKRDTQKTIPRINSLAAVRERLHVSFVPDDLPCRDAHFELVYTYLTDAVEMSKGDCIYISGVPGTGKTATVRQVVKTMQSQQLLENSIPEFKFIEINAMKLTDPAQAYCAFWEALFPGNLKVSPKHACDLLHEFFKDCSDSAKRKNMGVVPIILMVDELDLLLTTKQTVLYNLFNWPRLPGSPLVMVAIANTMDLPERVFSHKINSRVGGTRLAFHAYTAPELAEIVTSRVGDGGVVSAEAITYCTKKVAGMSGDARRALDICRKAIESLQRIIAEADTAAKTDPSAKATLLAPHISKETGQPHVTRQLVMDTISDLFSPTVVPFVRALPVHQKLFLLALRRLARKSAAAEATFEDVCREQAALVSFCNVKGASVDAHLMQKLCARLHAARLVLVESARGSHGAGDPTRKIKLNVSEGDLVLALKGCGYCKKVLDRET